MGFEYGGVGIVMVRYEGEGTVGADVVGIDYSGVGIISVINEVGVEIGSAGTVGVEVMGFEYVDVGSIGVGVRNMVYSDVGTEDIKPIATEVVRVIMSSVEFDGKTTTTNVVLRVVQVVYVSRDPRDVCVSYYYFNRKFDGYTGSFDQFVDLFLGDKGRKTEPLCIFFTA